jgi:hypothetical protein
MASPTTNDTTPNVIANDTNTTSPLYLNDNGGLQSLTLGGALSMTISEPTVNDESNDILIGKVGNDRFTSFKTKTPTYYIKIQHNINGHVGFNAGANDATCDALQNDDAWSLTAFSLSDANDTGSNTVYELPAANKTMEVAMFTANDEQGNSKEWGVNLNVVLTNDGSMSGSASLAHENDFSGLIVENIQLAQEAYWPLNGANQPTVDPTDGDILAATITGNDVKDHFAANMNAVEQDVNMNVVDAWTLSFNEIALDPSSNLSQYGQANNVNDVTLFPTGARIVAETPHDYSVTVTVAYGTGNSTVLVNDKVYGIVEQN